MFSLEPANPLQVLSWELTNKCTYACSYCPAELHRGDKGFPTELEANNLKKLISEWGNKDKTLHMDIVGGEPTLWPGYTDFLRSLNEMPFDIVAETNTNAARSTRWWQDNKDAFKNQPVAISVHPEYATEEHIINVVNILADTADVSVFVLAYPVYWKRVTSLFQTIKENTPLNVICALKFVRVNFGDELYPYTDEQRKYILTNKRWVPERSPRMGRLLLNGQEKPWKQIVVDGDNQLSGWHCNIGIDRLAINNKKDILTGYCSTAWKIGNLLTSWQIPTQPTICQSTACNCMCDATVSKWKIE